MGRDRIERVTNKVFRVKGRWNEWNKLTRESFIRFHLDVSFSSGRCRIRGKSTYPCFNAWPKRKTISPSTVARTTCKVAIERLPSPRNIYLFHDLEHASVTRLVYCEQLRVESLKPATLRESVNVTINSLHGSGGEKVDPTTPRISFHSNRTTFRITSVVNLPRNRSRIHLPWKPSASHWILSRNPAVYKFVARNRRKIM